jgi:hypothetical protein
MGNSSPHEQRSMTIKTDGEKHDSCFLYKLQEILISNLFLQNNLKILQSLQNAEYDFGGVNLTEESARKNQAQIDG